MANQFGEVRSDSPTKCGSCGGRAYMPQRFEGDPMVEHLDGCFNVCNDCGSECTGTDARGVTDRWYWQDKKTVAKGRAAMEAMQADVDWADAMRDADDY